MKNRVLLVIGVVFVVLILDQWLKIYIKTTFPYGTGVDMFGLSWAKLHFVENEGMAFGITFGDVCFGVRSDDGSCKGLLLSPSTAKAMLSIFRIIMVGFIFYLIAKLIKDKETYGLLLSFSLIVAGAIGNILDSAFYGIIFSESPFHGAVATMFPEEGGYAPFLHGKVVDMLYFPLIDTVLPDWFPFWSGERFQFFKPVFNIADTAISTGVISILLFHRRFFKADEKSEPKANLSDSSNNPLGRSPEEE